MITAPSAGPVVTAAVLSSTTDRVLRRVELGLRGELDLWSEPYPTQLGLSACLLGDLDADGEADFALGGASLRGGSEPMGTVIVCSGRTARTIRAYTRGRLGRGLER